MPARWYVAALLLLLASGLVAQLVRRGFGLAGWLRDVALVLPGVVAGCLLGRRYGLPEPLELRVDGELLPLLWPALGALLACAARAWLERRARQPRRADGRTQVA